MLPILQGAPGVTCTHSYVTLCPRLLLVMSWAQWVRLTVRSSSSTTFMTLSGVSTVATTSNRSLRTWSTR